MLPALSQASAAHSCQLASPGKHTACSKQQPALCQRRPQVNHRQRAHLQVVNSCGCGAPEAASVRNAAGRAATTLLLAAALSLQPVSAAFAAAADASAQTLATAVSSAAVSSSSSGSSSDSSSQGESNATTSRAPVPVYFGNGCFWGRQKDYVDAERSLGRDRGQISAVVGYAGGRRVGPDGKVCYYTGPREAVYEDLGHAEVVQVDLSSNAADKEMAKFAEVYFSQFRRTPFGMLRLDPQDAGPAYRNVVGLPGGVNGPLFPVFQAANKNGMRLVPSEGNAVERGRPLEDDVLNTVYVVDSDKLPFKAAEVYHQYHNGIGHAFPAEYTRDLKQAALQAGRIGPTGCPEYGSVFGF